MTGPRVCGATEIGDQRHVAGVDTFCAIRSYLATMARLGHSAFECLALVLQGQAAQPRFN